MKLEDIRQACEQASKESAALCAGKRKWTMSIPVDERDSDIIFEKLREAVPRLLAFVEAWDAVVAMKAKYGYGMSGWMLDEAEANFKAARAALEE